MFWFRNNLFQIEILKFSSIPRKNRPPATGSLMRVYEVGINIYQFPGTTITANQGICVLNSLWI